MALSVNRLVSLEVKKEAHNLQVRGFISDYLKSFLFLFENFSLLKFEILILAFPSEIRLVVVGVLNWLLRLEREKETDMIDLQSAAFTRKEGDGDTTIRIN